MVPSLLLLKVSSNFYDMIRYKPENTGNARNFQGHLTVDDESIIFTPSNVYQPTALEQFDSNLM